MWYQFSSEESYLLIQSARCRVAALKNALWRKDHPLQGKAVERARMDIAALEELAERLHDGGVWEVK